MCLTLPAKVLDVNNSVAKVLIDERERILKIGTSEKLAQGDWILYTNDFLIKKISKQEADEIFDLLSSYTVNEDNIKDHEFIRIIEKSKKSTLEKFEIEYLLSLEDNDLKEALYSEANVMRKVSIKDHICVHAIIEFSNHCKNNCCYCGLRRENNGISRYRMSEEEIVNIVVRAVNEKGYKIVVLQSGEDDYFDHDRLVDIIKEIKKQCRVFLYLSIGDKDRKTYELLKNAGANGVLYRFETSNPKLYQKLHPDKKLNERLTNLESMKRIGYILSTGSIIGLPGQTVSDLADDILTIKKFNTFMPSFGPLIPTQNTPLSKESIINPDIFLKMIAVVRLLLPRSRISVTTAMETVMGEAVRKKAFMAGANSVMFNLTPGKYRKFYNIYDNKFFDQEKKYESWALFKGNLSYQMLEDELKLKI